MFDTVIAICTGNLPIITKVPALQEDFTTFQTIVVEIKSLEKSLKANKESNAKQKKALKVLLCLRVSAICGALKSYGKKISDLSLRSQCDFSKSALITMRDNDLVSTASALLDIAQKHAAPLLDYNFTAEKLSNAQTTLTQFDAIKLDPRTNKVNNKTLLADIKNKVAQANALLDEQMDGAMKGLEDDEPLFFAAYENARRNYRSGIRHRQEEEEEGTPATALETAAQSIAVEQIAPVLELAHSGNGVS